MARAASSATAPAWPAAALPEGACVYAVGDIHGRADLLAELHDQILDDAEHRGARRRVVVYLGDYVDRGPASRDVIETLIEAPLPDFAAVHLKGNHEALLLDFLAEPATGMAWFWNGGLQTLRSYGVAPDGAYAGEAGLVALRDAFAEALPAAHRAFLEALALFHREGDYLFVHAGIRPRRALARQSEHDLIWIREEFLHSREEHGFVVVHGHTIEWDPQVCPNRIGIDTGAFTSGVLTCLALCGAERSFLQTG